MAKGRARSVHDYEQLAAELETLAENLLVPYYKRLLELGLPESIAARLVTELQADMIAVADNG